MKVAIIYKSLTGNTKLIAEAIQDAVKNQELVYIGEPAENINADIYFVGSWIDKGSCTKEISAFLNTLNGKKIAVFATAGFGGSLEYYEMLFERIKAQISETNDILGKFFCQGKMPMSVRDRYVSMLREHPDDKKLEVNLQNFDEALSHPNEADLKETAEWVYEIVKKIEVKEN